MPVLRPRDVIVRPLVTEKGQEDTERRRAYYFEVHPRANKVQVRHAIESIFDVTVTQVRTQIRAGKRKRLGFTIGTRPPWKKAIVTLKEGDSIEVV